MSPPNLIDGSFWNDAVTGLQPLSATVHEQSRQASGPGRRQSDLHLQRSWRYTVLGSTPPSHGKGAVVQTWWETCPSLPPVPGMQTSVLAVDLKAVLELSSSLSHPWPRASPACSGTTWRPGRAPPRDLMGAAPIYAFDNRLTTCIPNCGHRNGPLSATLLKKTLDAVLSTQGLDRTHTCLSPW